MSGVPDSPDMGLGEQGAEVLRSVLHTLAANRDSLPELGSPIRVFTDPPRGAEYPYVTLGAIRSEDREDSGGARASHAYSLHVWDRDNGGASLLNLLSRIQSALERDMPHTTLALFADIFPDRRGGEANPNMRHGLLRLRTLTEG